MHPEHPPAHPPVCLPVRLPMRLAARVRDDATTHPTCVPLAALMLAGALGSPTVALAQRAEVSPDKTLSTVTVRDSQDPTEAKDQLLVRQTGIAKGQQTLRDIPQTVTVMTEKLMSDRNLDDFREVLKTTAGVTFQAGETGEEDVRMRGFSLGQAGDIYVDGLRDAPLIERDTFNLDRVEVLKGSASMLFGKGSTGGVVNQVSKQPFLMEQNETNVTVGSGQMRRLTGDFNRPTGEASALRVNVMKHTASQWGAQVDKWGLAPTYRWHIGERDEYSVGYYHLQTDGRPLYNHPWVIDSGQIVPTLDARGYYGLSSDHLRTQTDHLTLAHKRQLDGDAELRTTLRHGLYQRDLWASTLAFCNANATGSTAAAQQAACPGQHITRLDQINGATVLTRTPKGRYGVSHLTQMQMEYNGQTRAGDWTHAVIAGVDLSREAAERNNSAAGTSLAGTGLFTTTVGTPNDGAGRVDDRSFATNPFKTHTLGVYAQDTVHLTDAWRVLGGLRVDRFQAMYADSAGNRIDLSQNLWSPRLGLIWQPRTDVSWYASYGTSYNTSGDTYQYAINQALAGNNTALVNTPPEKSRNLEVGGKLDVFEQRGLLGVALFRSEKYNERNTDIDTAANQYLLSGKRHATGMEFNFAGRITPAWEVFYNHTWIPLARIDTSSATGNAQTEGDRPALTPKHSASLWSTYRLSGLWRVGGGLNHRSAQSPDQNRTVTAAAFTTVDAMVEHTLSENSLLKLNVNNLTNRLYADQLYRGFYVPGAARRMELSLKTLF